MPSGLRVARPSWPCVPWRGRPALAACSVHSAVKSKGKMPAPRTILAMLVPQVNPDDFGIALDRGGRPFRNLLALIQDDHFVRDVHHQRHIVLDHQTRDTLGANLENELG